MLQENEAVKVAVRERPLFLNGPQSDETSYVSQDVPNVYKIQSIDHATQFLEFYTLLLGCIC